MLPSARGTSGAAEEGGQGLVAPSSALQPLQHRPQHGCHRHSPGVRLQQLGRADVAGSACPGFHGAGGLRCRLRALPRGGLTRGSSGGSRNGDSGPRCPASPAAGLARPRTCTAAARTGSSSASGLRRARRACAAAHRESSWEKRGRGLRARAVARLVAPVATRWLCPMSPPLHPPGCWHSPSSCRPARLLHTCVGCRG